jgi:mannan endo-1,4-beta-mannosidase
MLACAPGPFPIARAQVATGKTGGVSSAIAPGFHLSGRFILDANGNNFIMRGINVPHNWYPEQTNQFQHTKAKGANTVRVVLSSGQNWPKNTASDVANVINLCKTNKLICVLEVHDTTGYGEATGAISLAQAVIYWKEIKSVLIGQEAYVIINIGNEPYGNVNTSGWVNDTKNAITELRSAGFQHMLMVDAPDWGQDWEFIMRDNAASILNSDPNKNIVFSIHMYGVFNTASKIQSYLTTFVNAGLPLIVGEFGHIHDDGDPDENAIMSVAQSNGIGYLGWMWSGGSGAGTLDMVTNFNPQQETAWGTRIIHGPNGIEATSQEASVYSASGTNANVQVTVAGNSQGTSNVPQHSSVPLSYPGLNNGPVHVVSTNAMPIFTSERAVFGNSFNSIVGYPGNQLTTDYWFTSYDDVGMTTFLVIGNPHPTNNAQVNVYIGGNKMNATPYSIPPGGRIFPRYGVNGGPVFVDGINGVNVFTSQRTRFGNSFNEIMGYPANRVTTDYWFTSYDDVGMITYLVVGNPSTSQTAQVNVYIGGVKKNATPISIAPGQRTFLRYGVNSGPVFVDGINGVNIFASERTKFGNTFNEVLGYPANRLTTDYWFTSYDDVNMITYLVIGNPSTSQTAQVDVYMAGVKKNSTPISIAPGGRTFLRYGVNSGPVRVLSTNGVNVFASERSKYLNSFNEVLGLAGNQLTTDYWFTAYDNVGMSTYLVVAAP